MSPQNVGIRELAVHDAVAGARVPAWLLYPTEAAPSAVRFGPYALELAPGVPLAGPPRSLVVLSHGNGSTPWAYRGLVLALVRAGHAVAALEHPGNSRSDNSLANDERNLSNRPRHLHLVIEAALADPAVAPAPVAAVGHSIGGYTALAAAGGHAMTLPAHVLAAMGPGAPLLPDDETARLARPVETVADPRIAAVVALAPALGWFHADGALADVRARVLVRTGARDAICATARVRFALRSLPAACQLDLAEAPGADHFSFLTPFPPEMVRPDFPPSQDPPGFDRPAYQQHLQAEVIAFLRSALPPVG